MTFCMQFQTPLNNQIFMNHSCLDHLNTGLVQYLDPHCKYKLPSECDKLRLGRIFQIKVSSSGPQQTQVQFFFAEGYLQKIDTSSSIDRVPSLYYYSKH